MKGRPGRGPRDTDPFPDGTEVSDARRKEIAKLKPPVTAAEIGEILREAGAPFPLADPGRCVEAAARIEGVCITLARRKAAPLGRGAHARARDAVDELERVMPELLAWASLPVDDIEIEGMPGISDVIRLEMQTYRAKLVRLSDALFEVGPKPPKNDGLGHWSDRAAMLFALYRAVANPSAGVARSGPAVRFVQAMLLRIGEGKHSLDAIERTLQRRSR